MTDATAVPSPTSAQGPQTIEASCLAAEGLLNWIIQCQADPSRGTAYLGDTAEGVRAELEGLEQPWTQTVRVVITETGEPLAACAVEWDEEPAAAWLQGPWGTPDQVQVWGERLVQSMIEQLPAGVTSLELCGHVENPALAALSERLGWTPTAVNFAMVLPVEHARSTASAPAGARLPEVAIRDAGEPDLPGLAALHEAEFPDAYATTAQLLTRHLTTVAVRPTAGGEQLLGYASGQLQDDGQAYIDFTAVTPAARRQGLGRALMASLIQSLLAAGDDAVLRHVHLTVREEKMAARALYESMGFSVEAAIRGYRGQRSAD